MFDSLFKNKSVHFILVYNCEHGGLKLKDFESVTKSSKAILVKWLTTDGTFFKTNNLQLYFSFNQKFSKFIHKFYHDIKNYWSDCQCIHIDTVNATFIADQTI